MQIKQRQRFLIHQMTFKKIKANHNENANRKRKQFESTFTNLEKKNYCTEKRIMLNEKNS